MEGKSIFNRNKRLNLAILTDAEMQEFMDSVESDEEVPDSSSEDEYEGPDFADDHIFENMDPIDIDPLSFDIPDAAATSNSIPIVEISDPCTSSCRKRMRSPLPTLEETGPSILPSSGGFIGSGTVVKLFYIFKN